MPILRFASSFREIPTNHCHAIERRGASRRFFPGIPAASAVPLTEAALSISAILTTKIPLR